MLSHKISLRAIAHYMTLSTTIPSLSPAAIRPADPIYTFVSSQGIGNIAVRIECPESPRYPEGAPVVVEVGTWFVGYNEFHRVNDTRRIGAVTISYLWPGRQDLESGLQSDGVYDYGGPVSLSALRDVIRFASGLMPDMNGDYIGDLSTVPVLPENIGLFASSHSGVVAANVLAYFGEEIPVVKYLVGRENPTRDEMYPLELGYFDGPSNEQNKVNNPFYREDAYRPDTVIVDYSTVGWYQPPGEAVGRPYFAAKNGIPRHILAHDKIPQAYGKRYYSRGITRALLANGALTTGNWPDYLATPAETDAFWPYRITVHNYPAVGSKLPDLKVMLVFARFDHVQAAKTKPHIRQAWDGFHRGAGLWVRMNPDRAYVGSIDAGYDLAFPDNPANREPNDWIFIEDWGFPTDHGVREEIWLASVAEMADRVYMDNWGDNLDSAFFPVLMDSENTIADKSPASGLTPESCRLLPNFPNPFNPKTTIPVRLSDPIHVSLVINNLRGERVETLYQGNLPAGFHQFVLDAAELPTGMYVCRLQSSDKIETRKLILQK